MAKKFKMADTERVKVSAFIVQGLTTLCLAFLVSLTGFVFAWPSYTLSGFMSNTTVLSWPMTPMEVSLLGSVTNMGALLATPLCGVAVDTLGRKYAAMVFGVPYVLTWLIICLTSYVPLIIASMALAGVGAAGQAVTSVYISEIAQDQVRGAFTSTTVSGFFFGLLLSYILGGRLSYNQVLYVHLALSVLYIFLVMLLKESPVFLVKKGKIEEAAKSIAFYRQVSPNSKEVENEINKIKLQIDPQIDKILQGSDVADAEASKDLIECNALAEKQQKSVSAWKFLMNSESSKKCLFTALFLMAANILMGVIVLQVYAEPLFALAVPSMPSNLCAIFLGVDLMIAAIICAFTVDKFGRKSLMTYTSVASGFFTFLLATQLQFTYAPHWYTITLIYGYCFVYNLGAATVPYILTAELFLPEVRGICNSMVMACAWITNFITLMIFNPLVESYGLGPIFYGFTIICFLTAMYSHFYLPETKGLSADAIQLLFLKRNKRNVNRIGFK